MLIRKQARGLAGSWGEASEHKLSAKSISCGKNSTVPFFNRLCCYILRLSSQQISSCLQKGLTASFTLTVQALLAALSEHQFCSYMVRRSAPKEASHRLLRAIATSLRQRE